MRGRPSRLAGGAMGRLFASICGANATSRAPRINKAREPELECGGARLPRRCARLAKGTVRPLRLDWNLARVRFAARLD